MLYGWHVDWFIDWDVVKQRCGQVLQNDRVTDPTVRHDESVATLFLGTGGRRQDLVIIGRLNHRVVMEELAACLLTDEEYQAGPSSWRQFDDPFAPWESEVFSNLQADTADRVS